MLTRRHKVRDVRISDGLQRYHGYSTVQYGVSWFLRYDDGRVEKFVLVTYIYQLSSNQYHDMMLTMRSGGLRTGISGLR